MHAVATDFQVVVLLEVCQATRLFGARPREHREVALRVAEQLSRNYYTAYEGIRTLSLTSSPSEKFAKLLLSWSPDRGNAHEPTHAKMTLTPEEIADMIGTTRETG